MRVRQAIRGVVPPEAQRRKGYSFASPGLHQLLQKIAPALADSTNTDFSSRLAFLTTLPAIVAAATTPAARTALAGRR
jgi:hypothetical protein